jgi:hypothetical protein
VPKAAVQTAKKHHSGFFTSLDTFFNPVCARRSFKSAPPFFGAILKPKLLSFVSFALLALLGAASFQARAIGTLVDVTVIDRTSGATLPVHYHRGEYWVAGRPGAAYAISVRNCLGERVLAVTSVDGVNVLSGEAAGYDQTGYVFDARRSYPITGWRKSDNEVAAFEFSAASQSYASRTGRPGQVGVIGVALFREQRPEPPPRAQPSQPHEQRNSNDDRSSQPVSPERGDTARAAPALPVPAPSATAPATRGLAESAASQNDASALSMPRQRAEKLGTAHGAREASVVRSTGFVRLQTEPNEVIRIRYDSQERLIAVGIIREAAPNLPTLNPFPESARAAAYVPDPPPLRY